MFPTNYSILNSFPEEDLDLRVLPSVNTNKRRSDEHIEGTPSKKTKAEKFVDAYVSFCKICWLLYINLICYNKYTFPFNLTDYLATKM